MRKIYFTCIAVAWINFSYAQRMATLRLLAVEEPETSYGEIRPLIEFRNQKVVAIMGGLNDWDGMNNYFNIYGSKVIVQSRDISSNGIIYLVLRREDGDNFFGQYPTLRAEVIPHETLNVEQETTNSQNIVP